MNSRTEKLRAESLAARPVISAERARLLTRFYRENARKYPVPEMRARALHFLFSRQTIHLGPGELIVGERGPAPKETPTFPELTCHDLNDLTILDGREKTSYRVGPETKRAYAEEIIPYWQGKSMRELVFSRLSPEWHAAYGAGIFTEFMEQRAPGHTAADGKIYGQGMEDFKAAIAGELVKPVAEEARVQLRAMDICADAMILFARRHAALARELAETESSPARRDELQAIARVCTRVPAQAPRNFQEALQMYWFCHLGVITELNGWDAYTPGHLDQHLEPFYLADLEAGRLDREGARELLECFFIKFNNHPAPPKVGVTAAESGTYTDFANINLGGLRADGTSGTGSVSTLLLEVIADLHLLQPSNNVQISRSTPDGFLREAARVIRRGYGFPSVFNADLVVEQLCRQGKSEVDAREGGTSGCVEAGAFGKEAYFLTGYFNLPKILELALHRGVDPRSGKQLGPVTAELGDCRDFSRVMEAFTGQMNHFVALKLAGNDIIEELYAREMPAPFLSLITSDCIAKGRDYNAGGARYNTSYIQGVGIGTVTDSLAAIEAHVCGDQTLSMEELLAALATDYAGREPLRQFLRNRSPKWGNDDPATDRLMALVFAAFFAAVDGKPNRRGGLYHINMLPTTCHIYFGEMTGATPDGRRCAQPLSEGISPVQGCDRQGPTAVLLSAARMDQVRTGGTLLNMKFTPQVLAGEVGLAALTGLVRTYFKLGGHHLQFNVVNRETLQKAQADPESHRGLIVRVAGYSDYFSDLSRNLQDEIISRTEQGVE